MRKNGNEKCICYVERKSFFENSKDFEKFYKYLLKDKNLKKVIFFSEEYSNLGLDVNYFKCCICDCIWRIVTPDPPFSGVWETVENDKP
ncbi:MAG: hypothetical protein C0446_14835 [Chitinophaga sp.]|nr:hypothetical protein [Chitinophaga sp.]